jgi:hypothetical protein
VLSHPLMRSAVLMLAVFMAGYTCAHGMLFVSMGFLFLASVIGLSIRVQKA